MHGSYGRLGEATLLTYHTLILLKWYYFKYSKILNISKKKKCNSKSNRITSLL